MAHQPILSGWEGASDDVAFEPGAVWEERFAPVGHVRNLGSMATFALLDAEGRLAQAPCTKGHDRG